MMLTAFLGNADTRTAALARLNSRLQAGGLTSGAMFLNASKATPAAAMVDSNDVQVWQDRLGLAKWLAYALDYGSSNLPASKAVELAGGLLNAIPIGCDTTRLGSRVILQVLASVAELLTSSGETVQELLAACHQMRALHERALAGDAPAPAAWRVARKAATEVVNAIDDQKIKALGGCIEAAAWDPAVAPTTVGDVLRIWNQSHPIDVNEAFGWTAEDDERTRTLLGEMNEKYRTGNPDETRDVFMLLREHHPEAEARLLAYTKFQRTESVRISELTAKLLLDTVEALQ